MRSLIMLLLYPCPKVHLIAVQYHLIIFIVVSSAICDDGMTRMTIINERRWSVVQ